MLLLFLSTDSLILGVMIFIETSIMSAVSLVCDVFGFHGYYHGPVESFFRMWAISGSSIHSFIQKIHFEHVLDVLWKKMSLLHESAHNKCVKN